MSKVWSVCVAAAFMIAVPATASRHAGIRPTTFICVLARAWNIQSLRPFPTVPISTFTAV